MPYACTRHYIIACLKCCNVNNKLNKYSKHKLLVMIHARLPGYLTNMLFLLSGRSWSGMHK